MKVARASTAAFLATVFASEARAQTTAADEPITIEARGTSWSSPRGVDDRRVTREMIDASPRERTSEMLSAAPGFFVDHEDGDGLGNDIYLRGWDLSHGSGIEMRVGPVPINIPSHVQGQGYADANFIIPEVVRGIRVLEGPFDPRQGDAAIVGSALFDLGVVERGYELRGAYGSFNQARVVAVAAPEQAGAETFLAFEGRRTDGFGVRRDARSGSINAQVGFDLGASDHVVVLATAYGAEATLPGVVREDDVNAGRVDYFGAYPFFTDHQAVHAARFVVSAAVEHLTPAGARFDVAPWAMWTDFRSRQNFTGDLESSRSDPSLFGLGDLYETANREAAGGVGARYRSAPVHLGESAVLVVEPGVQARLGHTDQSKSLLVPDTAEPWDHRLDAGLETFDGGAYVDLDVVLFERLRLSGGARVDVLVDAIHDRLADASRTLGGASVGPRLTAAYSIARELTASVSYGEGFRSLDVATLVEGARPYSKVRSIEAGFRAEDRSKRLGASLAVFDTWVDNELVFVAESGGLETEGASTRRGVVSTVLAKPVDWLLGSFSLSVTNAVFTTRVPGISHYVPNVPPLLFRADLAAHHRLVEIGHRWIDGRAGAGLTFLSGKRLTDTVVGPSNAILNASLGLRYGMIEIGADGYNLFDLRYPDDAEVYVSNWSLAKGQQPASLATHFTAAPPLTVLGSAALHF